MSTLIVAPFNPSRLARLDAVLDCPPDKSLTHRALLFAALARGQSHVENPLLGADCKATMAALSALGVGFTATGQGLSVDSPGWDAWRSPLLPLDFANSGTTARLLTGVFAATPGLFVVAFGDESLSQRPMARVVGPLKSAGAQILGRQEASLLPLAIAGARLRPQTHVIDKASAQVKSALLLAALNTEGLTTVRLPAGSRDHTERLLVHLGADLTQRLVTVNDKQYEELSMRGPFRPPPGRYLVPGDPSSAAFFAVLVAILPAGRIGIRGMLANPTRLGFFRALRRMGASLSLSAEAHLAMEPTCDLTVEGGAVLSGLELSAEDVPALVDEVPILAVAAAFARGPSRLCGLSELRVKESDRLASTMTLLSAAGARVSVKGDELWLEGGLERARPFCFDPRGDHRLAMAAGVLAATASGPCEIVGPDCVAVSFPDFFARLLALAPE